MIEDQLFGFFQTFKLCVRTSSWSTCRLDVPAVTSSCLLSPVQTLTGSVCVCVPMRTACACRILVSNPPVRLRWCRPVSRSKPVFINWSYVIRKRWCAILKSSLPEGKAACCDGNRVTLKEYNTPLIVCESEKWRPVPPVSHLCS